MIVIIKENKKKEYNVNIFKVSQELIKLDYCYISLFDTIQYIKEELECLDGNICIDDEMYNFKSNDDKVMIELPCIKYIKSINNTITELFHTMTNIMLCGLSEYSNHILLEIKEDNFDNDMLETIATLINHDNLNNIVFINYDIFDDTIVDMICFDANTNKKMDISSNFSYIYHMVFDYYKYHFEGNKKYQNHELTIRMGDMTVNLLNVKDTYYIYK